MRCLPIAKHRAVCTRCGSKMHIAPGFVALTFLLRRQISVPLLFLLSHLWDRPGSKSPFLLVLFVRGLLFMSCRFNQQESPIFHSLFGYTLFGVWYLIAPKILLVTQISSSLQVLYKSSSLQICRFLVLFKFWLLFIDYTWPQWVSVRGFSSSACQSLVV